MLSAMLVFICDLDRLSVVTPGSGAELTDSTQSVVCTSAVTEASIDWPAS